MKQSTRVSIIIPVHNEEDNITPLTARVIKALNDYENYEVIFINDGSHDQTGLKIENLAKKNSKIKFVHFTRNFGHQAALRAGMTYATGDCVISLDGDMQHPPELIGEMIQIWKEGYSVVSTIRKESENQGPIKKITSKIFYSLINKISDIKITPGAADFRLIDKEVKNHLLNLEDGEIFFRGQIPWLGYKEYKIFYVPEKRAFGNTKFSLLKMNSLALSGITTMSTKPLHFSTKVGLFVSFVAFSYATYSLYIKFFTDRAVDGWTSIMISVLFLGGVQLISIGILGEYIGKLFNQTKKRPHFIVAKDSFQTNKTITKFHSLEINH